MKVLQALFPSRAHGVGLASLAMAACLAPLSPTAAVVPLALFVGLSLTAPFFPRWSFFVETVHRGPTRRPEVALTFDDGPARDALPPLLELLDRQGVKATFFLVGERVAAYPEAVALILAGGHAIGNHSWSHDPLLMLRSQERLDSEVRACQAELARHGVTPLVFRPPVGITNPRLPAVLRRLELSCIAFRKRPLDFSNTRLTGLSERVVRSAAPGDLVVLHDSGPGPHGLATWLSTVASVIIGLKARGLAIVPLEEFLGRPVMRLGPSDTSSSVVPAAQVVSQPTAGALAGAVLSALLYLGYPALAYLGITFLGTRTAAILLMVGLGVTQLRRAAGRPGRLRGLAWLGAAVAALLVVALVLDDPRFILAYPTLVNLVLLAQFGWSVRAGPPMVERFARLQVDDLSPAELAYCRTVTLVWCAFFLVNGGVSGLLALGAPRSWWALYSGLVAYVLMGLLFAVEYVIRKVRFGRFGRGPIDRVLAHLVGPPPAA